VTEDQGHSFEIISPDLSRNDPKTTGETGGPITKDQTGAEVRYDIHPLRITARKGVIWTGSDDGLVHITKTMGQMGEYHYQQHYTDFSLISMIHTSEQKRKSIFNS
jgi:hypothetical protein